MHDPESFPPLLEAHLRKEEEWLPAQDHLVHEAILLRDVKLAPADAHKARGQRNFQGEPCGSDGKVLPERTGAPTVFRG